MHATSEMTATAGNDLLMMRRRPQIEEYAGHVKGK